MQHILHIVKFLGMHTKRSTDDNNILHTMPNDKEFTKKCPTLNTKQILNNLQNDYGYG